MENRIINTLNILDGELSSILDISKEIFDKIESDIFSMNEICEDLMKIISKIQDLERNLAEEITVIFFTKD